MNVIEHGVWRPYRPETLPPGAPANALFARRENDAVDWYDYVNSGEHFGEASVKLTVGTNSIVGAAIVDPTALFPANATVLEVTDPPPGDPQTVFGGKIYDPDTKEFRDPPPPVLADPLAELRKRLEALEAKP